MEGKEKDLNAGRAGSHCSSQLKRCMGQKVEVHNCLRCSHCVVAPTHNNGELYPPVSSHLYKTFNYTPPHKS